MNPGPAGHGSSRRDLLRASGAAAAAGLVLEACGSSDTTRQPLRRTSARVRAADVELLNQMLDLEYATIVAYVAGIPFLRGDIATATKQFLGQEMTHAGELQGLIKEARGKPHPEQYSYDLGPRPGSAGEVLVLLQRLEAQQLSAYLSVIPKLSPGTLRAAVASIAANDAQHLSLVRAGLGLAPAPAALVTGQP